jgi:hypothetical protein
MLQLLIWPFYALSWSVLSVSLDQICSPAPDLPTVSVRILLFLHLLSRFFYLMLREITRRVSVISLIWQNIVTSEGHIQARGTK